MSRNRRCPGAGLGLVLLIGSRVSWAQGPAIDHKAVACIVADKFAGFEARFDPAENVSRARIYFRAEGGAFWYFVDMKPQRGAFQGLIPKPKKSSKRINYYIDVMDKAFAESRTQEYSPEVVRDASVCSKKMAVASVASSASVTVGASPGAPAIPAGFSSSGVVPAGAAGATAGAAAGTTAGAAAAVGAAGGLSGGAIAGIVVGGAAAAAGGVVLATHKSSSPPTTTLPPSVTGTWRGVRTSTSTGVPSSTCSQETDNAILNLVQSDATLTGTTNFVTTTAGLCADGSLSNRVGFDRTLSISGSVTFPNVTYSYSFPGGSCTQNLVIAGNAMSGPLSCSRSSPDPTYRAIGTLSVTRP